VLSSERNNNNNNNNKDNKSGKSEIIINSKDKEDTLKLEEPNNSGMSSLHCNFCDGTYLPSRVFLSCCSHHLCKYCTEEIVSLNGINIHCPVVNCGKNIDFETVSMFLGVVASLEDIDNKFGNQNHKAAVNRGQVCQVIKIPDSSNNGRNELNVSKPLSVDQNGKLLNSSNDKLKSMGVASNLNENNSSKLEDKVPEKKCIICVDADRDVIFYKCGHICCCSGCAQTKIKGVCPICRSVIKEITKFYFA